MAYDPDLNAAKLPWDVIPESVKSHFTPIGYDLEPELKFAITIPRELQVQDASKAGTRAFPHIQQTFLNLAKSFQRTTPGQFSFIDANGINPRDYALVNLGQDEGRKVANMVLPLMTMAKNGYQYRERFAVPVFSGTPLEYLRIKNYDANAKTLLSQGQHRREFETHNDSSITPFNSFDKFRQIPNLPDFFQGVNTDHMYVIKAWMTSRSSLITLSQVPSTGLYALCEHCCDITRYTTGNFEVFINDGRLDPEWETEIKGFYGHDPRLASEAGQKELIDIVFADITRRFQAVSPNLSLNELSKMERARDLTDAFYAPTSNFAPYQYTNNPITPYLESVGAPLGLSHAFTQAVTARSATSEANLPRIVTLAAHMPNPIIFVDRQALNRHIRDNQPVQADSTVRALSMVA